ncbi:M56 family metallopeptidase [Erythrobacter sp. WG]|uniref:M56 family metallopeptidase n=1 Tax=Erythrobacter sp. WG TaxID=2985510 RepID=UPI00226DA935|nr:M56 family metallopeptidase [Erythrobacter sp. WG]MCX9148771.1 M56 family metallopeptidase [Erythrobacter sp. WG]
MSGVLLHTLVWTGVLIAAVLVLRRPVSRHFGPEAAYALWALPLFRLVLPPVTLPAWMAPAPQEPAAALDPVAAAGGSLPVGEAVPLSLVAVPAAAPEPVGFDLVAALSALPWLEALLLVWLAGAGVTLWLRFAAYFALRDELLAAGREVGRAPGAMGGLLGRIRLVETPATAAPLAMGVIDPVIALPPGFLAHHDRPARDLALAHELAHHRGGDLLVNVLVQPLFALHWWNPLGRYGWLALRRDQEAACDARVMAHRKPGERAAYAALIARFAAQPGAMNHAALTAPMACPVLGEKSIIHRLRSLTMSEPSPRRRLAGRALLGAGLLALPLTASISYAASETPAEVPQAPEPPAPPAPPSGGPDLPPPPPPPGEPQVFVLDTRDGDGAGTTEEVTEKVWRDADGKENRVRIVMRTAPGEPGPDREAMKRRFEALRSADRAEREAAIAELRAEAEAMRARGDMMRLRIAPPRPPMPPSGVLPPLPPLPPVMVTSGCKPDSSEMVDTSEDKDGRTRIMICQQRIADVARAGIEESRAGLAEARAGLEEARAEIAGTRDIPEETRKLVLDTLDTQIERLKRTGR